MKIIFRAPVLLFLVIIILFGIVGCTKNTNIERTEVNTTTKITSKNIIKEDIPNRIYKYILGLNLKSITNISDSLNSWASTEYISKNKFIALSVVAEKYNPSLPDTLLLSYSTNNNSSDGYALYWFEGDTLNYKVFKAENVIDSPFPDNMTVISARISKADNGSIEIGAIFDGLGYGNGGQSKPCPVYKLLRLEGKDWRVIWSSPDSGVPQDDWQNNHGLIKFSGQGISEFTLEGDSLLYTDGKESILSQTKSGSMRYFKETWSRQGDEYIFKKSETIPTAFNTLLEFIYSISKGDEKTALKYVNDKSLINKAKELELVQKSFDGNWPVAYPQGNDDKEQMKAATQLIVVTDQEKQIRIKVDFVKKDNQFLISGLNK